MLLGEGQAVLHHLVHFLGDNLTDGLPFVPSSHIGRGAKVISRLQERRVVLRPSIVRLDGRFQEIHIDVNPVLLDFFVGKRRAPVEQRIYPGPVQRAWVITVAKTPTYRVNLGGFIEIHNYQR